MGDNQKYIIDFKLQVVGKYEQGKSGYKRLSREFKLSHDTVREWCLNPKLHSATEMAEKKGFERGEKIGRKQGILQTEKKMKQCNTYIEFIQKITGLPLQK